MNSSALASSKTKCGLLASLLGLVSCAAPQADIAHRLTQQSSTHQKCLSSSQGVQCLRSTSQAVHLTSFKAEPTQVHRNLVLRFSIESQIHSSKPLSISPPPPCCVCLAPSFRLPANITILILIPSINNLPPIISPPSNVTAQPPHPVINFQPCQHPLSVPPVQSIAAPSASQPRNSSLSSLT